jgi:hypothetical protein
MGDPEPMTPEAQFDEARERHKRFHAEYGRTGVRNWMGAASPVMWMIHTLSVQNGALRDMIASLDAEVARLTETANRREQEAERDMIRLSCILDRQRVRIAALESPGGDEGT